MSEKYKFSTLLEEMEEAGELVDTDQWIGEVKELERRLAEAEKLILEMDKVMPIPNPLASASTMYDIRQSIEKIKQKKVLHGEAEG